MSYLNRTTSQWQSLDAAHHLHPFTDHPDIREKGTRVVSHAKGAFIYDTDGNEILDGMAGLWCVNIGYGHDELADAKKQMEELPYYNSFSATVPTATLLAEKLAQIAPSHMNNVFGSSGSESNDTALRIVRHYWALEGKPQKNIVISRDYAYHGSTIAGTSLGGMSAMHDQLALCQAFAMSCTLTPMNWHMKVKVTMILAFALRKLLRMPLKQGQTMLRPLLASLSKGQGALKFRQLPIGQKSSVSAGNMMCF